MLAWQHLLDCHRGRSCSSHNMHATRVPMLRLQCFQPQPGHRTNPLSAIRTRRQLRSGRDEHGHGSTVELEGEGFQVRHFSEQLAIATFRSTLYITLIQRFSDAMYLRGIDLRVRQPAPAPGPAAAILYLPECVAASTAICVQRGCAGRDPTRVEC